MSDSLPPMTDETLAAIERRIDAFTGSDHYQFTIDGIGYDGHWAHDTRRLIAEVKRLRGELADFRQMAVLNSKAATEAVDRARSECAALAAKVEAARQGLAENLAEYEQVISSFKPPKTMGREEEEHRDLARAETAEARNCLAIFDAAMGSGMPHTPAQEAQERPGTREGDTGTGTGVQGPHGRSEAALATIRERAEADYVTDPDTVTSDLAKYLMQARLDRQALLDLIDRVEEGS